MKKNFYNADTCTDILLMTQCLQYALPEFDAIILYSRPIHNRLVLDQYNNSDTTLGRLKFLRDLPTKLNIIFLRKKKEQHKFHFIEIQVQL